MINHKDEMTADWSKFTVIKNEDVERYLGIEEKQLLKNIQDNINYCRRLDHRRYNQKYIVVNIDESYTQEIVDIMKANGHWG